MPLDPVRERLTPIIESGQAATCSIIDLEVLFSARNADEHQEIRHRRGLAYSRVPLNEEIFQRAIEIQGQLALRGWHRIPIAGVVIAAAAETAGLTVLHYDADFERIAEVTGEPMQWVAPRGTV